MPISKLFNRLFQLSDSSVCLGFDRYPLFPEILFLTVRTTQPYFKAYRWFVGWDRILTSEFLNKVPGLVGYDLVGCEASKQAVGYVVACLAMVWRHRLRDAQNGLFDTLTRLSI